MARLHLELRGFDDDRLGFFQRRIARPFAVGFFRLFQRRIARPFAVGRLQGPPDLPGPVPEGPQQADVEGRGVVERGKVERLEDIASLPQTKRLELFNVLDAYIRDFKTSKAYATK